MTTPSTNPQGCEPIVSNPFGKSFKKFFGWMVAIALVLFLGNWFINSVAESERKAEAAQAAVQEQKAAAAALAATPITLACGGDKDYSELPDRPKVILVLPPLGNCWTAWQTRPDGSSSFWVKPSGNVRIRSAFGNGTTEELEVSPLQYKKVDDNPLFRKAGEGHITAMKFQNPGTTTVTIDVILR